MRRPNDRKTVREATQKLRTLGYLDYADSDGGRNKRNSYTFKKGVKKRACLLDANGSEKSPRGGPKSHHAPGPKSHHAITPSNLTLDEKGEG